MTICTPSGCHIGRLLNYNFISALFGHDNINTWFQGFVVDSLPRDAIDDGAGEVDGCGFNREFFDLVVTEEGDEGDEAETGVVSLMEDVVFHNLFLGGTPVVAYGHDVAGCIVV